MKNLPLLMCTAFCGLNAVQADAADNKKDERPNILWLTFEDTSAYEFGCYGVLEITAICLPECSYFLKNESDNTKWCANIFFVAFVFVCFSDELEILFYSDKLYVIMRKLLMEWVYSADLPM